MPSDQPALVTAAAEAEQLAVADVRARYLRIGNSDADRLVLCSERTVTLAHGWVVFIGVIAETSRDERMDGPDVCYVEAATGTLITSFWSRTSFALQELLYRLDQGREPDLPWPQLTGVRCADGDHLRINLMPHRTFCGNPLTGSEQLLAYADMGMECVACRARTNGLGMFCFHCGRRLPQTSPPWYCATCPQPPVTGDEQPSAH